MGWGRESFLGPNTDALNEVVVPVLSNDECKETETGREMNITENMLCAGYPDGEKDACRVFARSKNLFHVYHHQLILHIIYVLYVSYRVIVVDR